MLSPQFTLNISPFFEIADDDEDYSGSTMGVGSLSDDNVGDIDVDDADSADASEFDAVV